MNSKHMYRFHMEWGFGWQHRAACLMQCFYRFADLVLQVCLKSIMHLKETLMQAIFLNTFSSTDICSLVLLNSARQWVMPHERKLATYDFCSLKRNHPASQSPSALNSIYLEYVSCNRQRFGEQQLRFAFEQKLHLHSPKDCFSANDPKYTY